MIQKKIILCIDTLLKINNKKRKNKQSCIDIIIKYANKM